MNTPSNAVPESLDSQGTAPAVVRATRPLYWSVRRELWENRYVYIGPLIIAGIFLVGFLVSMIRLRVTMHGASGLDPAAQHEAIEMPYDIAAGIMMATAILVSLFYCADALHGERRDRSILFWKSLPVSDLTTVIAKASIPLLILPLLISVITGGMHLVMLLWSSALLLGSGANIRALWAQLPLFRMWLLMLYHLLTAHALWPAPVYCWLLLVSGWARRATFLWASLPIIAISGVERLAFHTSHFAAMVGVRFIGSTSSIASTAPETWPTDPMTHVTPGMFLGDPGLWIGLVVAAAFLFAAIRLRRYQGPI